MPLGPHMRSTARPWAGRPCHEGRGFTYNAAMFRLTRKFGLLSILAPPAADERPTNSYGGFPSLAGLGGGFRYTSPSPGSWKLPADI